MHGEDFDLDKFRIGGTLTSGVLANSKLRQRRRYREQFVRVPVEWMHRLNSARLIATWKVALHLLDQSFKEHRHTVRLANGVMVMKGVTRWQKWRALKELETFGLINIENRPRKTPEITLLYPEEGG
jgi:hypothetical protein